MMEIPGLKDVQNDGKIVQSRRVTASDNWKYSFTLPQYINGKLAEYSILEDGVPYYSLVKRNGYDLVNEFKDYSYPGDPDPAGPLTPPKTGDTNSLILWASLMAASAALLTVTLIWGKKSKENQAA